MALLVGAICAVVLVLKSIRDFTRTGPEMAEEVLKHYRLYLAYSLARLVVFTLLITAFMAFLGVVVDIIAVILLGIAYHPPLPSPREWWRFCCLPHVASRIRCCSRRA